MKGYKKFGKLELKQCAIYGNCFLVRVNGKYVGHRKLDVEVNL